MVNTSFNLNPSISSGGTFSVNVNNSGGFNAGFSSDQKNLTGSMGVVNATSTNYNDLANKPKINGVELIGNKTNTDLNIINDKNYVHTQAVASQVWEVNHGLNKYCSVVVVDSGDSIVVGDVVYIDTNNVRLTFAAPFSGKAYFN